MSRLEGAQPQPLQLNLVSWAKAQGRRHQQPGWLPEGVPARRRKERKTLARGEIAIHLGFGSHAS